MEIVIVSLLLIGLVALALSLIYKRYIYSYNNEIEAYLKKAGLTYQQKTKPTRNDWKNSPFEKPPIVKFSAGSLKILGMSVPVSDSNHFIISTKEGKRIWLELHTSLWDKPLLQFKPEKEYVRPGTRTEVTGKHTYPCPACNYTILESEDVCPDCGIHIN